MAEIVAEFDYDPVSDAVVSWRVDPNTAVTQQVAAPPLTPITAIALKLRRHAGTNPIDCHVGTERGGADLGRVHIPAASVNPWFPRWVTVPLPDNTVTPADGILHLQVRLPAGSPGAVEWNGTATRPLDRPEVVSQFGYASDWDPDCAQSGPYENPMNVDYGTATPHYEGGAVTDGDGTPVQGLSLAFRLLAADVGLADFGEEDRFTFVDDITGPLSCRPIRDRDAHPQPGEIMLDSTWTLVHEQPGPILETAAGEFENFLRTTLDCPLRGDKPIRLEFGEPTGSAEGFAVHVQPDTIAVSAEAERGLMAGLHYIEALMRMRRAPILPLGRTVRTPRWRTRLTCAPFATKAAVSGPVDAYTDGLLGRIARAGFNAVWVLAELPQLGRSSVFPELDEDVGTHQARLRSLTRRAARYGISIYAYVENHPLPAQFFAQHPHTRGSRSTAYGGVNVCCTSVPEVQAHIGECFSDLVSAVPEIGGVILGVGGEGFFHCHTRDVTCPRCGDRPAGHVVADLVATVTSGVHTISAAVDVVAWPYSASNWWSADDTTQSAMIRQLPTDTILMTEFAKEAVVRVGKQEIPAYDYPISTVGPSQRFVAQRDLGVRCGHEVWVKTEHAIALEFVQTPYIPANSQWLARQRRIAAEPGVTGVFGNWTHYGFLPSRATDIFYWTVWGTPTTRLLQELAVRDFGGASGEVLHAWQHFSEGIRQYPFSAAMALGPLQSGLAHPFFLDPAYRPRHGAGRQFCNDLSWTEPWGPDLARRQLERMAAAWATGIERLHAALDLATELDTRREITREHCIAATLLACMRSANHLAQFIQARDRLASATNPTSRQTITAELTAIVQTEIDNASSALPYVRADSRLGYSNSSAGDAIGVPRGGLFGPRTIEKKIGQLRQLLDDLGA